MRSLALFICAFALQGCAAKLVETVVEAPFKVAGAAVDAVTTTQKEADLKRGRAMRKAEEREAKAQKKANKQAKKDEKRAAADD